MVVLAQVGQQNSVAHLLLRSIDAFPSAFRSLEKDGLKSAFASSLAAN